MPEYETLPRRWPQAGQAACCHGAGADPPRRTSSRRCTGTPGGPWWRSAPDEHRRPPAWPTTCGALLGAPAPVLPARELTLLGSAIPPPAAGSSSACGCCTNWPAAKHPGCWSTLGGGPGAADDAAGGRCSTAPRSPAAGLARRYDLDEPGRPAGRTRATPAAPSWRARASSPCAAASSTSSPRRRTRPVRLEFFGDELDAMGYFDPVTQRRVENAGRGSSCCPWPRSLPAAAPRRACEGLARGAVRPDGPPAAAARTPQRGC